MKRAYCKYIFSLLLFGTNGIVASGISLTSYEIVLFRTLIGAVLLFIVFRLTGGKAGFLQERRQLIYLMISGGAMGASWMFLYEAYQEIGVGMASLIYYCGPVLVMALSPLLFHERLTWAKAAGFLTVLAGIFFVNSEALEQGKTAWGLFCAVMSAVMYAVMVIANKRTQRITGLENTMAQLLFAFLTVAAFVCVKQGLVIVVAAKNWPAIALLGIVNTGMGCYLYFSSIGRLPVQTVAICGYLEPLSAVVFSALLLQERMAPAQVLGALLILGGALFGECADFFLRRRGGVRTGG